jgi:hypothetical protein
MDVYDEEALSNEQGERSRPAKSETSGKRVKTVRVQEHAEE